MNALSRLGWFAFVLSMAPIAAACEGPCQTCTQPACVVEESQPSWIFRRSTYSHDPVTGARVAQYERIAPVEPLEDERNVTSSYRRTQTNLRGADGSTDTYYQVQAWGNNGGIDAQWERFHDAWKESILQGTYYNQSYGNGYGSGNNRYGFNGSGYWNGGGNWGPGGGGHGPWNSQGGPGWNGRENWGGGWNGGGGPPPGP